MILFPKEQLNEIPLYADKSWLIITCNIDVVTKDCMTDVVFYIIWLSWILIIFFLKRKSNTSYFCLVIFSFTHVSSSIDFGRWY